MIELKLSSAAEWMDAKFFAADQLFQGVSIDSRTVQKGNLFFAIKGDNVDAHDFLEQAQTNGAAAAVVDHYQENISLPQLQVDNSILALGRLAKRYRQGFSLALAAVTGSCGKTTVKEMLASILSMEGPFLASKGNLNTEIGVPLSLLCLAPEQRYAVIEMGARQKGDIRYLMNLVEPDVTLITNAGVAHLEIFGSERGIAEAKGEIFSSLKPQGTAVINADDPNADYWRSLLSTQAVVNFGLQAKGNTKGTPLDFSAANLQQTAETSQFDFLTPLGNRRIQLKAFGEHNVSNAVAAAAVAYVLGISLDNIVLGLEKFLPVSGRLQFKAGKSGIKIMDDTYNANPVSVLAALAVLANCKGKKIFVMGDMLELGSHAVELHREIGEEAQRLGIDKMYGFGRWTAEATKAFGSQAKHYPDKATLIQSLEAEEAGQDEERMILIKGSRGMKMEEIVQALMEYGN